MNDEPKLPPTYTPPERFEQHWQERDENKPSVTRLFAVVLIAAAIFWVILAWILVMRVL